MPLIVVANLALGKSWANLATWLVGGIAAWGLAASSLIDLTGALLSSKVDQARFVIDAGSVVSGAAAGGFLFRPIRKDIAAFLPIDVDNPVHTLALVLAVILFGTQLTSLLFTDTLAFLGAQKPQSLLDLFLDEVPLLVLAVTGVGLVVRRTLSASALRLGLIRPAWWQPVLALAAAGLFVALLQGFDLANHALLPSVARRVDAVDQHLFSELAGANWWGLAAIALLPGICEEVLFRGALQPRIGLVPAALLFTSIHSQYGLSLDLAGIFAVALSLGLIRKYTNTTTSMSAHVSYNLLAGISLAGTVLYAAIALETVLLAVAGYAIWKSRRATPSSRSA